MSDMLLQEVPGSWYEIRGLGGVGGAVDLSPELGNPVLGATDVTPCDRWLGVAVVGSIVRFASYLSIAAISGWAWVAGNRSCSGVVGFVLGNG